MSDKAKSGNKLDISAEADESQGLIQTGIRLEPSDLDRLDRAAATKSMPRAVLGRVIVREWLDREQVA